MPNLTMTQCGTLGYVIFLACVLTLIALPALSYMYSSKNVSSRNYDEDTIKNLHCDLRNAGKDFDIPREEIDEEIIYIDSLKTINGKKDSVSRFISRHEKLYNKRLAAERANEN